MPSDPIRVDTRAPGASQAGELLNLRNAMQAAYAQGNKVRGVMMHAHDGTDFTDLEQLYGLAAGEGQVVFDLVNGAIGSMEGQFQVDDAKELCDRIV